MNLFAPIVHENKQHSIFKLLTHPELYAERNVITDWASGFIDRDNKFIKEFQTTFESSFFELYLNKILMEDGVNIDLSHHAPDFVCSKNGYQFSIEATIANPEHDGLPAYGIADAHTDFAIDFKEFNRKSIIRIANSIITKSKKFNTSYINLQHVRGKPFMLGLNSFDRPHSHFVGHRGIIAVLYGIYLDEEEAIEKKLNYIPHNKMDFVTKDNGAEVPLGFFTTPEYENISAIIYNPYATWGKVRALAELSNANKSCRFNALYTRSDTMEQSLLPQINPLIAKEDYKESIFDGLYVFSNPYAKYPLQTDLFSNSKVAHMTINEEGNLIGNHVDQFLLSRTLICPDTNSLPPELKKAL